MFLDKYTTSTPPPVTSEGTAFAQKGKKGKKGKDEDKDTADADKTKDNPYANMTCFKCNKKGHPAKKCPDKEKDADDASISSKGSKTSLKSLEKTMKSVQKSFAQLQAAAENSDDEDEEQSHFQFLQLDKTLSRVHFKQSQGKLNDIDLREVILLDSCSTCNLFCNRQYIHNIKTPARPLKLTSNGGSMLINKLAKIGEGHKVWYSKQAVTNILSLKFVGEIYHVTYDSNDGSFVMHRDQHGMPDLVFRMHHSGLHFFDPRGDDFAFVTTVEDNKIPFSKRQIERAEKARTLHASLGYPSERDLKWILRSHQIKDCPVTVQDAEIAFKIWGPNIASLK